MIGIILEAKKKGNLKIGILCSNTPVGFKAHVEILASDGNISKSFIVKGKQRKSLIIFALGRYGRSLLIAYSSSAM